MFFLFIGCIDELNITTERVLRVLVVEGNITTQPGPHFIRLSKSAKFGSIFEDFSKKVNGALVRIRDEKGNQVILEEVESGVYATPSFFSANVGSEYTLIVESNEEQYISIPEKVQAVPPIESIRLQSKRLPSSSETVFDIGVEVFVDFTDPGDEQNFYLLKNNGTYVVETNPELFTMATLNGNVSAPKDCCNRCWINEESGDPEVRITSDDRFDGNQTSQLGAFIVDDGKRYTDKYLVRVEQHSLTKEAFRFFEVLESQLSISGDLFDPPPATLRGNIINVIEPSSPVIGYFYASDVSIDSIFLDGTLVTGSTASFRLDDDCRVLANSSTQRPSFW